ncbi:MAG: response regulator [Planctomycetota bacterium]
MPEQPTILICDDEPHILHVVGLKLREAGYGVLTASSGKECLHLARQHQPVLLITDYVMPGMNGIEVCRALREDPVTAEIDLILLTARGGSLSDSDIDDTGFAAIFSKPFSPRELLAFVKERVAIARVSNSEGDE